MVVGMAMLPVSLGWMVSGEQSRDEGSPGEEEVVVTFVQPCFPPLPRVLFLECLIAWVFVWIQFVCALMASSTNQQTSLSGVERFITNSLLTDQSNSSFSFLDQAQQSTVEVER